MYLLDTIIISQTRRPDKADKRVDLIYQMLENIQQKQLRP